MKPLRVEPGYEAVQYWQSARSKQVLEALRWLNHGNRDLPDDKRYWTLAERSGNEWNAHYTDTLKLIEGWSENEEPSAGDYYSMKAGTYNELARLVPPGPARDNAMRAWLNFLEHYYGVLENRNLWFSDVSMMLGSVRALKDETDRAWLLDEMARSANPVISLYAQMEKLAPRGR